MAKIGTVDLEDLSSLRLDKSEQSELLEAQTECSVIFNNVDGWPSGVIMTFLQIDGAFWFTAIEGRTQVLGIDKDPRISMVISNAGTGLEGRRMLSVRGIARVHRDAETKQRILMAFAKHHQPDVPDNFYKLLDSENRLVIKVIPTAVAASHTSTKMAGDGRGGPKKD